jgi:PAS domain S-box-containing protein
MGATLPPQDDIATLRERLARAEATLAAIVESSQDAILAVNADGSVRIWNASAERIFGYTAAEARGQRLDTFVAPESLQHWRDVHRHLREGRRYDTLHVRCRRKDGAQLGVAVTLSPLFDASRVCSLQWRGEREGWGTAA